MHPQLQPLQDPDPDTRLSAADVLAERFEQGHIQVRAYPELIQGLLQLACDSADAHFQEAVLNALNHAMIRFQGDAKQFDWQPLIAKLPNLAVAPLAEALQVLSLSMVEGIRKVIAAYIDHKNLVVRDAAGFALDELEMMGL